MLLQLGRKAVGAELILQARCAADPSRAPNDGFGAKSLNHLATKHPGRVLLDAAQRSRLVDKKIMDKDQAHAATLALVGFLLEHEERHGNEGGDWEKGSPKGSPIGDRK